MKKAFVMLGAPGSGKSTLARSLVKERNFDYICYDLIRKELWGDESVQGTWPEIHREVRKKLSLANSVVIDGCHALSSHRKEIAKDLREFDYDHITGIYLNTPLKKCLEQNSKRDRKVPEYIVIRFWNTLHLNVDTLGNEFDALEIKD
jgi:predicted kinase